MVEKIFDIVILGGGASGLFCASQISDKFSVLILEGNENPAQKLLLSAKGRGNITNATINPEIDYSTDSSGFVKSAFLKFGVNNFIKFLKENAIEIKEEDFGRILLTSGKVSDFQKKLIELVNKKGFPIIYNSIIKSVKKPSDNLFEISTNNGTYKCKNIIVATGGPSFPKLGASGIAIEIAKSFNLDYSDFYPALVGFETEKDFSSLSGSSIIGKLTVKKESRIIYEQNGPILFTHRGISGPTVFNASLFLREGGDYSKYKIQINVSTNEITKRLLAFLGFKQNKLSNYQISTYIKTVRGLDEAKVCGGGVKTKNLNENFGCKDIPGLYFIGECLDVTGKTGGYNLQRCRTSGAVCAKGLNSNLGNE